MNKLMNRRNFLSLAGFGVAALITGCAPAGLKSESSRKRPNILFIMSDDHSYNAISCYGGVLSKVFKTPNIDLIAREGVRLDNCFVTNSICSPSRAVILTGKYSHLNSQPINYTKFDTSQQTVPKLMRKAGYNTAMIGKWHLRGEPTGFDYWNILPGQGRYIDPDFMEMELKPQKQKGYVTTITTDIAIDWLENKWDRSKPFFMMCHHKAPHEHWRMDPADEKTFENMHLPEPQTLYDDHEGHAEIVQKRGSTLYPTLAKRMARWKPEERAFKNTGIEGQSDGIAKAYQHYLKHYLGCIHSIDRNIGRMLDCLRNKGILDNTLVIYTSDNGMFLGEHSWHDKRMMYEESLKIPFIARYPSSIKMGTVSEAISLNLDFPETFLDFAGAEIPADMQGESLRPVLQGREPADWRKSMFYAYYEGISQYGVRTRKYKLICYSGRWNSSKGDKIFEPCYDMFDLEKDPLELESVYDDPAYAGVRKMLENEIVKLRKKYKVRDKDLPGNWEKLNKDLVDQGKDKSAYK